MLSVLDHFTTPPGGWQVREPSDGHRLTAGLPGHLWSAWAAYRLEKGLPVLSRLEMEDVFCRQLPAGCETCGAPPVNPHLYPELDAITKLDAEDKSVWGARMWEAIHRHRLAGQPDEDWRWLRAFEFSIPCKVSCKPHFTEHIALNPPDFTSQEAFSHWAWKAHQSVNARLGRPGISWEECQERYAAPQDAV